MDEKKKFTEQITTRWNDMSRPRQIALGVIVIAIIIFIVLMLSSGSKQPYTTLYSNLDPTQASALVQFLRDSNVPYSLDDFGRTIKVPADRVDELRIEMAGKGVPYVQDLGFDIFDNEPLGTTDFERQVKMQRALQEELRRTITSLDAIEAARVHLTIPEPQLFLRDRGEPSAAVYLKLNPFVSLREDQIRGIVSFVAYSVEGLKPENVVIIDSMGNMLYDAITGGDYLSGITDSYLKQLEIKRFFELELERRVQTMLGKVFGPGKALALVTVDLDFDAREMTMITYDDMGVPRSTEVIEESFEGQGPLLGEVGEPNYPGYVGLYSGSGDSRYNRNEERINNEISQITERVIAAPGKIMGIYTSVVVDAGDNDLTEIQLGRIREQVRELVSAAIGLDEERGDQISVQSMSFDTSYADGIEAAFARIDDERRQQEAFRQTVLGAILLLLVIAFLLALRRRSVLRRARSLVSPEGAVLEDLLGMRIPQEEEGMLEDILLRETSRELAQKFLEDNPELSLAVLRTWLTED